MPIDCSFERSDILDWDIVSDGANSTGVVTSGTITVPTAENWLISRIISFSYYTYDASAAARTATASITVDGDYVSADAEYYASGTGTGSVSAGTEFTLSNPLIIKGGTQFSTNMSIGSTGITGIFSYWCYYGYKIP